MYFSLPNSVIHLSNCDKSWLQMNVPFLLNNGTYRSSFGGAQTTEKNKKSKTHFSNILRISCNYKLNNTEICGLYLSQNVTSGI